MDATQWGAIVGSVCILMAWSYLYKENEVYNFAEHLLVGIAVARGVTYTFEIQLIPILRDDMAADGRWHLIIPAILGILIYTRFFKDIQWVARITMGFWMGYGIGYQLAYGPPVMFGQVKDSFINLIADTGLDTFNNILYFLIIITVFLYFAFTLKKESGPLKYGSQFGRYALMIAFGSAYGSITMAYLSLIIGKLEVILKDALHLIS